MKILLLCILVFYIPAVAANELVNSPSPYLAMHGKDPVNWQGIDQDTLKAAHKTQKLIFISSGYFACHWCHVMQRESYQDKKIAEYLNSHFVPIKIDREMNPVLDAQLIQFVERTRGVAGWPLNVFLTPDGYPLFGLTYLPPDEFYDVLTRLSEIWINDPDSLMELAQTAANEMQTDAQWHNEITDDYTRADLTQAYLSQVRLSMNELQGGFGDGSKFPLAPQLLVLLRLNQELDFVRLSLDAMSQEHLVDHISGGFFRYTTDPDWQTPHFEKMLYDNALLAQLYLVAGSQLDEYRYEHTGIETLHFVLRTMRHQDGGYIASLSAIDTENIEGGYYLWNRKELSEVVDSKGVKLLETHWGMNRASLFEDGYLPTSPDKKAGKNRSQLYGLYKQLRIAREKNLAHRLPVDDKRLSAWNGLLLSALAFCAQTGDEVCKIEGSKLAGFLLKLRHNRGLVHGLDRNNLSLGAGNLEDYAFVIQGLADWGMAMNNPEILKQARDLLQEARSRFHRKEGWMANQSPLLPGITPQHHMPDTVLPSPTTTLLQVDRQLSRALKKSPVPGSEESFRNITRTVINDPFSHASLVKLLNINPTTQ